MFSYVGYENAVYSLIEYNGGSRIQKHQMSLSIEELEEVQIVSDRVKSGANEWAAYYQLFSRDLFGTSENSAKCRITNPEVIEFDYKEPINKL